MMLVTFSGRRSTWCTAHSATCDDLKCSFFLTFSLSYSLSAHRLVCSFVHYRSAKLHCKHLQNHPHTSYFNVSDNGGDDDDNSACSSATGAVESNELAVYFLLMFYAPDSNHLASLALLISNTFFYFSLIVSFIYSSATNCNWTHCAILLILKAQRLPANQNRPTSN